MFDDEEEEEDELDDEAEDEGETEADGVQEGWLGMAAEQDEMTAVYRDDPLYPEVAAFVGKHGRVSVAMLQRHFRMGYTRAARLLAAVGGDG